MTFLFERAQVEVWQLTDLENWELALAIAAHERVADKTGRCGWHSTESARQKSEPGGYELPLDRQAIPVEYAEWCWPA